MRKNINSLVILVVLLATTLFSCSKDEENTIAVPLSPTVTTAAVTAITMTTATVGGVVTFTGDSDITATGIVWSLDENPTVNAAEYLPLGTSEAFSGVLTNLEPNTEYHIRAYAVNGVAIAYGEDVTFTTLAPPPVLAEVSTDPIDVFGTTTAEGGGEVITDNGFDITARGLVYGTVTNPTIANSKTTETGTVGAFSSNLTGLTANTTYYVKAYATNAAGTAYGEEVTFTTAP